VSRTCISRSIRQETENACKIFYGKICRKIYSEGPGVYRRIIIKCVLKIGLVHANWILLAQNRHKCLGVVITLKNIRVLQDARNSLIFKLFASKDGSDTWRSAFVLKDEELILQL
jgi:hypothetical protein